MKTRHTQGQWMLKQGKYSVGIYSPNYSNGHLADVYAHEDAEIGTELANAQRIVKAVNMHDELVEALKDILSSHKVGTCKLSDRLMEGTEQLLRKAKQK